MKSSARIVALAAVATSLLAAPAALAAPGHAAPAKATASKTVAKPKIQQAVYTCPMHPEVKSDKPGDCPKCGMHLEKKSK